MTHGIGILRIINHTFPIQWNTHIKTIALLNILTLLIKKNDFNTFMKRLITGKHIHHSTGYVRPRRPNGEWIENTNPYHAPGFCEGSAWQFTWYVPHDVKSLINLIGERQFIDRLNAGFATSEKSKLQCFRR